MKILSTICQCPFVCHNFSTVVLVVVFAICWAPFHTDRLMWSFINDWTESHLEIFQYVHIISGVFFYLSSAVNPILYNLMSTRFREMFKEVMCHRQHHITPRKHSLSVTWITLRSTLGDANSTTVVEAEYGESKTNDETIFTRGQGDWFVVFSESLHPLTVTNIHFESCHQLNAYICRIYEAGVLTRMSSWLCQHEEHWLVNVQRSFH